MKRSSMPRLAEEEVTEGGLDDDAVRTMLREAMKPYIGGRSTTGYRRWCEAHDITSTSAVALFLNGKGPAPLQVLEILGLKRAYRRVYVEDNQNRRRIDLPEPPKPDPAKLSRATILCAMAWLHMENANSPVTTRAIKDRLVAVGVNVTKPGRISGKAGREVEGRRQSERSEMLYRYLRQLDAEGLIEKLGVTDHQVGNEWRLTDAGRAAITTTRSETLEAAMLKRLSTPTRLRIARYCALIGWKLCEDDVFAKAAQQFDDLMHLLRAEQKWIEWKISRGEKELPMTHSDPTHKLVPIEPTEASQVEWLKNRLASLQLPADRHHEREEWLLACGMPPADAPSAPVRQETAEPTRTEVDRELYVVLTAVKEGWLRSYASKVAALRLALSPTVEAETAPADVRALVIAARDVAFSDAPSPEALRALDKASDVFADRVRWEDEPEAHHG